MRESVRFVEAVRARDSEVLEKAVREHAPVLLRAARASGLDDEEAQDAVQETMLVLVQKADQFDGRASLRTWLFGILFNKISERRRKGSREESAEDIERVVEARFDAAGNWTRPPRRPDADAAAEQVRRFLRECMELLSGKRRSAFVLSVVDDMPREEVCKILDVSINNLGVLLFRARNSLRECLEEKGISGRGDVAL